MNNNQKLIGILVITFLSLVFSKNIFADSQKVLHEKTFQTSPGKTLEVESPIADVTVQSWDNDEVYVKITGDNDAKEEIEFTIEETSTGVLVKGEKRSGFSWDNIFGSIDLNIEVKVPSKYNTEVKTSGGDIKLGNVEGENELSTSGGDIKARDTKGRLTSKTSGGDIWVQYHEGETELSTSGGDIKCKKVEGELSVSTSGGDIELESAQGRVSGKTSGGDVMLDYRGENMGIELSTSGGDIDLIIPGDFEADLKLRSWGGDIETELTNVSVEEVSSDKYNGKMNGGGKMVKCTTSGGDVTVKSK